MKDKFLIGLIQSSYNEDINENVERNIESIREAKKRGAELICLPELHNYIYFCQKEDPSFFDYAETIPGRSTELYGKIAKELGVVLLISIFERRGNGIYHNTAVLIESDGNPLAIYRKMHIPDDPGFYEKFYFTPGDLGFVVADTSFARIGLLICWDQWFCEAARITSMKGAELLLYPSAIGWDLSEEPAERARQLEAWITVQRGHSIVNGVYVASINRVGLEKIDGGLKNGITFWGSSFVAGPQGEILSKASVDKEEILITEIDRRRIELVRRIWPFFRDRRVDRYEEILKLYL